MAFKLKTSKKSEEIFSRIEASENLPFYVTVKLAMAMSMRSEQPLIEKDFHTNTLGRELNRQTITGDADALYKCLMELYANRHLSDEGFFPDYVKAHIDRGALMLDREQKYGEDFLVYLTELEKGI